MIRCFLLSLVLAFLSGCTTQSMQAEMLQAAIPSRAEDLDEELYAWTMDFAGIQLLLYAVSVQDGTVFANRDGAQVAFDGQDVVLVQGLPGAISDIVVRKGDGGVREHVLRGVDEYLVECEASELRGDTLVTACRHATDERVVPFEQRTVLNEAGQIVRIEAVLVPGATPMVLEPILKRAR